MERQLTLAETELFSRFEVQAISSPGVFDELDEDEILTSCTAWIDGGDPTDSRNWRYFAIAGFMAAIGHDKPRVLDVGCGIGWPTFILAPFCKEVVGLDYSEKMIRVANRLLDTKFCYDNVRFVCADMGDWTSSSGLFDVITSDNSIDLGSDPLKQIVNLQSLLKPGGCLVADLNNIHDVLTGERLVEETIFSQDHFTYSVWDGSTYERRVYQCHCVGASWEEKETRRGPPSREALKATTEVHRYVQVHFDPASLRRLLLDAGFTKIDLYCRPSGWVRAVSEFEAYGILDLLGPKRFEILASLFAFAQPTEDPRAHFVVARGIHREVSR